jgi:hypothetical protein
MGSSGQRCAFCPAAFLLFVQRTGLAVCCIHKRILVCGVRARLERGTKLVTGTKRGASQAHARMREGAAGAQSGRPGVGGGDPKTAGENGYLAATRDGVQAAVVGPRGCSKGRRGRGELEPPRRPEASKWIRLQRANTHGHHERVVGPPCRGRCRLEWGTDWLRCLPRAVQRAGGKRAAPKGTWAGGLGPCRGRKPRPAPQRCLHQTSSARHTQQWRGAPSWTGATPSIQWAAQRSHTEGKVCGGGEGRMRPP